MVENGIMDGYGDGTFAPDKPMTRAELCKIIGSKIEGNGGTLPFTDVEGHWAAPFIARAYGRGIINGYPDGTFRPDDPVKRVEAAKIFNIYFDRGADKASLSGVVNEQDIRKFGDIDENHWGYYEIMEAANTHRAEKFKGERDTMWNEIMK